MIDVRSTLQRLPTSLGVGLVFCLVAVGASGLASSRGRVPGGSTETCTTAECHVGIVNHKVMHGPVAQGKCEACHVEIDAPTHKFRIIGDPASLCLTCHPIQERTFEHTPVRQGHCTGCHDPHGSNHATMLVADPTEGLCQRCHQQTTAAAFVHGPVASGACILCHEPHTSWHPDLLTESPRKLCLGCHTEIAPDPERDRYRHEPVEQDCLLCHDAHASDVRHHLHEPAPQLCDRCHESTRDLARNAAFVHGALTQEGGCLGCHSAHYSPLPALQRKEEIDLCLGCHDKPLKTGDERVLTDMAALLREKPDHHGPIREGDCTTCHLPHASTEPLLLRHAYPPEFYAPYDLERYALCFECHLPEMVQNRQGTGVTGFRDGDVNLHWLHVNRAKGRTCRACHEVHASRNPFHIRDSVPFGSQGWALQINYARTAVGGSCSPGCHKSESYDHGPGPGRETAPAPTAPKEGRP